MTTLLLALLILILLTGYFTRVKKRALVKPVAPDGRVGPELLATKTRWDIWMEKARPWGWGVMVGMVVCPVCGYLVGWWQ